MTRAKIGEFEGVVCSHVSVMRMKLFLVLTLFIAMAPAASAERCFTIRGRAVWYRGDGFFAIWHIGTHHEFYPRGDASIDLLCKEFDCESGQRQPALFADFTVCPMDKYVPGAAQAVTVTKVEHPRVVADWPPADTAKEYIESFVEWCGPPRAPGEITPKRNETLRLAQWDQGQELRNLIERNPGILTQCGDLLQGGPEKARTTGVEEEFRVGEVTRRGGHYQAQVLCFDSQHANGTLMSVVEFRKDADRWLIDNFRYPSNGTDLLAILKAKSSR
ncbi:hypothetical protein [Occallatibacter riparius]|uniref:DUF3828 domain-containing protein n=1 Tax=Occallatibacter riparius TaxID=1002689 RepID=A0A9J7BJ86_9BACT|nr:hypothetical protein [Occallatibacter riparius]UWZ82587.1 hypothetical protein MOP44_18685 [Occallatibacter riparius]